MDIDIKDVESRLEKDLREYNNKQRLYAIIGIILLLFTFRNTIIFHTKFFWANVSGYDSTPMKVKEEPLQINYPDVMKYMNKFEYKSLVNNNRMIIIPQAYYKISGLVVAHNYSFLVRSDFFDSAALYDVGIAWGPLSDKKVYKKYFKSYSDKNEVTGSRVLWTRAKNYELYKEFIKKYGRKYQNLNLLEFSHSHLVPANRNVMAALLRIRDFQHVEIEGQLIDMQYKNKYGYITNYHTSTVRNDGPEGNRGNGSCETILVKSVRIGNRVYK